MCGTAGSGGQRLSAEVAQDPMADTTDDGARVPAPDSTTGVAQVPAPDSTAGVATGLEDLVKTLQDQVQALTAEVKSNAEVRCQAASCCSTNSSVLEFLLRTFQVVQVREYDNLPYLV